MKRTARLWGIALLAVLLLAAAGLYGLQARYRVVRISEAQLQAQLKQRFPLEQRVLRFFQLRLTEPQLEFLPESQRVALALDARLSAHGFSAAGSWGGQLQLEAGLRYEEAGGAFHLVDPVLTRFALEGLSEERAARLQAAAQIWLQEWFREKPVYALDRKDFRQGTAHRVLRDLRIENREVVLELGL